MEKPGGLSAQTVCNCFANKCFAEELNNLFVWV